MSNEVAVLVLVGGFVLLILGAEVLVRHAARLGLRLGLRPIVVGTTIVALGTSAPEFLVSLLAGFRGETEIALGNIVGSNVANLALVLGFAALLRPIPVGSRILRVEYVAMLLSTLIVAGLVLFRGELGATEGTILSSLFAVFLVFYVVSAMTKSGNDTHGGTVELVAGETKAIAQSSLGREVFLSFVGLSLLLFGAHWVVEAAVSVAKSIGWSQAAVGATIVAVGTSLPELATSAVAAWKGEDEIAVGNILGSNVFNLLFVLGPTALVHTIPVKTDSERHAIIAMVAVSVLIYPLLRSGNRVSRSEGLLLMAGYAAFVMWIGGLI